MLSPLLYGPVKGVREACYANEEAPPPFVGSIRKLLPDDLNLTTSVWYEVNYQIADHIRGKGWEILIIWGISYLAFKLMGLQFTLFLILRGFIHTFMP